MKRSAGVTACAVIVILGSALILLFGVLGLLGIAAAPVREGQPHFIKYFMWLFLALMFGGAGWGIASGVGLLQLREWARISILLFSGLLLFLSIPGLLMIPFTRLHQPPDLPDNLTLYMRVFLATFYCILAGLGVWWIIFFNRKSVRALFQGTLAEAHRAAASPARPISITIISWYLLISAFIAIPFLFLHMPIFLLGFLINGWASSLFMLGCAVLQLVMGSGLLKLKPWARSLAIGYFAFLALNAVLSVMLPGSQARYEQAMKAVQESFGVRLSPVEIPIWFGLAACLPLFGVLLWFLVAQKKSFLLPSQISAPLG